MNYSQRRRAQAEERRKQQRRVHLWSIVITAFLTVAVAKCADNPPVDQHHNPADEIAAEVAVEVPAESPEEPEKEIISLGEFKLTHYCPCKKCCGKEPDHPAYGITSTGTAATEGRTIAVDPDVIPYGTEVIVCYADGTTVTYIAEDCGGSIKGNRLDVYMDSHEAALIAGVKFADVYIVKE